MAGIPNTEMAERTVRIFLAAPARDTQALREVIEAEIERIRCSRLTQRLMRVELIRWDDETRPIPMSWLRPPQEAVNHFTGGPSSCDLVIGVFRHVFGSELDASRFGTQPDGRRWACTEWELHCAAQAAKEGLVKDVLVFRDESPLLQEGKSDEVYEAEEAELRRVRRFIAQVRNDRSVNRGVHNFVGASKLAEIFPGLIDSWLSDYLDRVKDGPDPDTGPQGKPEPAFDLRPYLTRRRDHWRSTDAGQLDRRFVNLSLMIDHGLAHDGPRHTQEARFDRLSDLLAKRPDVGAWVLVGDPGGREIDDPAAPRDDRRRRCTGGRGECAARAVCLAAAVHLQPRQPPARPVAGAALAGGPARAGGLARRGAGTLAARRTQ